MHVAVKCSFLFIFHCKLKIKVKFPQKHYVLEENQLCADCLPCDSFLYDILVGLQAVVNTTPGITVCIYYF